MVAKSFSGGDKLQAKLAQIAKRVAGQHSLRVGFLEGATYPDEAGTPVASVAFWLNYGHGKTPPRPFFTDLIAAKADSWGDDLGRILEHTSYDVDTSLALLGERIAGQVRQSIVDLDAPALSPVTLMIRKMLKDNPHLEVTGRVVGEAAAKVAAGESYAGVSAKVGVYTGHMLNSVAYEVTQ